MVAAVDWIVFGTTLAALLLIDVLSHSASRVQSRREAGAWSIVWIGIGLLFTVYIWLCVGSERAQEYIGAYLIEKSLSLDNLFLFLVIFQTLRVSEGLQPKALIYGVMGALLFRAILIVAGVEIIERFHWTTIIFGVILFGAAYRTMLHDPRQARKSGIIEWLSRHFKVTEERNASGLFVKEEGVRKVTPLFIAIIALELTDILFAVDSVPAALSISRNVFVVYSSNAFAILGLRSLYLAMHGLLERYKYLHYGLGVILFLAGVKITLSNWLEIPAWAATTATILVLVMTITLSPREEPTRPNHQRAARR